MKTVGDAVKELAAIARSRKLVQDSLVSEDQKAAMLAELERQEKAVSFKTDSATQSGKK